MRLSLSFYFYHQGIFAEYRENIHDSNPLAREDPHQRRREETAEESQLKRIMADQPRQSRSPHGSINTIPPRVVLEDAARCVSKCSIY